ncbi:Riboflavin transporter [Aquimixticola soesokkakensis]|uniref:Riboflavin transporter n=2 Tax=Aquimixticola soesokkakensis TaxID=1519096 RepID=A0A1Y5T0Q9_9RHOB|nr:Riboflavin transporter [Aquimixticola soesokkakensis]
MLATGFCLVTVNVLVKFVGEGLPPFESAFLRFVLGLVFLIPAIPAIRAVRFTRRLTGLFVLRAVAHAIGVCFWFFSMTRIPLGDVTAMNFMNPVYVTLGAALFFGEKLGLYRASALFVAFLGGLVILRPGFREIDAGHVAMIFTAIFFAIGYLTANRLSKEVPASVVVAMMSLIVPICLAPLALAHWVTPSLPQIGLLFATAFFATIAHYCMTRAFAVAPMAVVQPVTFLQLVWAMLFGVVLFGEALDPFVLLGGALILGSVSFITLREARLKRGRTPSPEQTKL